MDFVFLIMTFDPLKCFPQHYGLSDRRGGILLCSSVSGKALLRKNLLPRRYRLLKKLGDSPLIFFHESQRVLAHGQDDCE
jgi:hypothetical protein